MAERINGVHHIGVSVPSLAAARAFYVDMPDFTELAVAAGGRNLR